MLYDLEKFYKEYKRHIFKIALSFTKNQEEAEDWSEDIIVEVFSRYEKYYTKIKYPDAWIKKSVKNCCIDRDKKIKKILWSEFKEEEIKDQDDKTRPENKLIAKETPHSKSFDYLSQQERESLDISLEWIQSFYLLRNKVRSILPKYDPYFEIHTILTDAQKKIKRKLYIEKDKTRELAARYRRRAIKYQRVILEEVQIGKKNETRVRYEDIPESESEPGRIEFLNLLKIARTSLELDKELENIFSFGVQRELDYLIESTKELISANPIFNRLLRTPWFSHTIQSSFKEYIFEISGLRIHPEKLIFRVWHKAYIKNGKGKYSDLRKIVKLILAYKEWTLGTDKEFLFKSLQKTLDPCEPKTFSSLRMSLYKKTKNKDLYDKLSNFIYQKSFKERVLPDDLSKESEARDT